MERAREWWRVRHGEVRVVVGTRSAIFAPLENLGLIIVDEEQESSYKQEEVPRYHGRDTAVYRARLEGAVVLLGSATPSLETYHNARAEKYRLLTLASRVANRPLAEVRIVDLREEFRREHRAPPVSEALRAAIALRLEEGTQAMVLINRRGYSWSMLCRSCGSVVQCQNCSIALTYHKSRQRLECHYCGYSHSPAEAVPEVPRANICISWATAPSASMNICASSFPTRASRASTATPCAPSANTSRCSAPLPTARSTSSWARKWSPRATIFSASRSWAWLPPISRSAARIFAPPSAPSSCSRKSRDAPAVVNLSGEVLVETYYPEHYAIQYAVQQDYVSFYEKEAQFRRMSALSAVHRAGYRAGARPQNRKRHSLVARALAAYFAPFEERGVKILGPGGRAARAPAPRIPLSVCAEVPAPRRPGAGARGLPRFLRLEGNSRNRRDRRRRPHQPHVKSGFPLATRKEPRSLAKGAAPHHSRRDTGSERFFGEVLFSKATSARPDAGTLTLCSRTISLAVSLWP